MAEHDADRGESPEPEENRPGAEPGAPEAQLPEAQAPDTPSFDEDAAWAAIVAGYGDEPPDPPGAKPFKSIEDLALLEVEPNGGDEAASGSVATDAADAADAAADADGTKSDRDDEDAGPSSVRPLGGSVVFAPGVGPRDFTAPAPSEDDFDENDEGHFVPPEPPPLPNADVTAKFAWLAVVGGPLLLLLSILLGWQMTWWLTTLGVGGFIGGFFTLVVRMRTDDEEDDDPGRGAVV